MKGARWLYYIPGSLWAGLILYFSFRKSNHFPAILFFGFLPFDKLGHFCAYLGLSFLFTIALRQQYPVGAKRFIAYRWMVVAIATYGILIEFLQALPMIDRSRDFFDIVANILGCFAGIFVFNLIFPVRTAVIERT
ncbi:MAG: VanZ family protein [Chitinophagales bacterium]|nr:VanZ family protein [Chitinophagales bacterium]